MQWGSPTCPLGLLIVVAEDAPAPIISPAGTLVSQRRVSNRAAWASIGRKMQSRDELLAVNRFLDQPA